MKYNKLAIAHTIPKVSKVFPIVTYITKIFDMVDDTTSLFFYTNFQFTFPISSSFLGLKTRGILKT